MRGPWGRKKEEAARDRKPQGCVSELVTLVIRAKGAQGPVRESV